MALPSTTTNVTTRKLGATLSSLWSKIKSTFATKSDVNNKVSKSGDTMTGQLLNTSTGSAIKVSHGTSGSDTFVSATRTDTSVEVNFGVGSGGINHGVYSTTNDNWMIMADNAGVVKVNKDKASTNIYLGNSNLGDKSKPIYLSSGQLTAGDFLAHTGYQGTKEYHIAVENTSTSPKGWCSIVRVTKTSGYGTYDAVRIIGRLYDHKGNWEQSASEFVDFIALVNVSNDSGTLYLGKSGISAEMRLVKVAARDYELQYNASTAHCDYDVYYQIEGKTGYATPTTTYTATTVSGTACSTASLPSGYNAFVADKATGDESGNNIKANYASSLSISNHSLTLKNKNGGTLSTVTVPDSSICGYCGSLPGDSVKIVDIFNYTPTAGNIIYINFANANAVAVTPLKMKLNGTEYTLFINGLAGTNLPAGTWPCSYNGTSWTVWTDGTIPNFGQQFRDYDGSRTYAEIRTRMEYGLCDLIAVHGVIPWYANILMPLTWAPSTVDADIAFSTVIYGPPGSTSPTPCLCQTVVHSDNTITHTQTQLLAATSTAATTDDLEPLLTASRGVTKQGGDNSNGAILGFYDNATSGGTGMYGISFNASGCLRYNNSYIVQKTTPSTTNGNQEHLFLGASNTAIQAVNAYPGGGIASTLSSYGSQLDALTANKLEYSSASSDNTDPYHSEKMLAFSSNGSTVYRYNLASLSNFRMQSIDVTPNSNNSWQKILYFRSNTTLNLSSLYLNQVYMLVITVGARITIKNNTGSDVTYYWSSNSGKSLVNDHTFQLTTNTSTYGVSEGSVAFVVRTASNVVYFTNAY